ncbi:MAG: 2-oxoacid:acceptor oxidoreductase family protein [Anaerolineae bacterium]|nr:2-oxoacid:acceptor oxidoreductase family protein [Anaerolineae bacterium]
MAGRIEVRLAGEGGQGLILAGVILAEAAAVHDGLHATQTQSYGPEARGGASKSEVVISDEEIDYPKVIEADYLLAMSQEACDRYVGNLRRDGLLIVDSTHVTRLPLDRQAVQAPITRLAEEVTGRRITANVVALGVLVGLTGVVSRQAIEKAVRERAPKGTEDLNLRALAAGLDWAEQRRRPAASPGGAASR